jgi:hypothetical protein
MMHGQQNILRKMFDLQREKVTWNGEGNVMMSFMTCTVTKCCSGDKIKTNDMGGECIAYGGKERTLMWKSKEKRPLGKPRHREEDNTKINRIGPWTQLICLRTRRRGELLWKRWWTFGFHKMRRIFWLTEDLLVYQEWFCRLEEVRCCWSSSVERIVMST